jgi:hypothetical protein
LQTPSHSRVAKGVSNDVPVTISALGYFGANARILSDPHVTPPQFDVAAQNRRFWQSRKTQRRSPTTTPAAFTSQVAGDA